MSMSTPKKNNRAASNLTQKDLMERWDVSIRTVQRDIRRYQLEASDFIGHQPVFEENDIRRMEQRRKEYQSKRLGLYFKPQRILSMKELRAIKKKAGVV